MSESESTDLQIHPDQTDIECDDIRSKFREVVELSPHSRAILYTKINGVNVKSSKLESSDLPG